ncbi:MAG: RHS repeat-associated core domain-containing protein [Bryobacteraceae bacterium]
MNGANGASSSIGYDQYARKTSTTSPTGATTSYSYTYNPATVTVSTTAPNLPATWAKSTQDGYGRTVKEEKGYTVSGVSTTESVVDTVYEPCGCTPIGKLKKVSRPYAPGGSASAWTVYNYDAIGRTVSTVAADGASTTIYEYVSNTVKTTDPAGKWKKYTLDGLGRLTQVNEPKPGGGSDLVTNYDYDLNDKLKTVTMPRVMPSNATVTQTRSFVYNAAGQMTSMSIPEWGPPSANGTATYFWNGDKIGSKTDAKGQRIDYQYDSYRRLSNVRRYQTGGAEDTLQRTDYYYDSNPYDAAYSQNAVGRLTAVHYWVKADPTAIPAKIHEFIEMFSYTPAGLPTKKKLTVIKTTNSVPYAASLEVQYSYDGEGKLISVKHPDHYNSGGTVVTGKTLTYDYTEMARLKSMKEGTTDWVTGVSYNIAGQMTAMNGETRTYNVMGQMISMGGMQYNYPGAGANNGRIVSQTLIDGESVSYQYDSLNRLSSATGTGWSQTYAYDGFGNMTDQNGTGSAPSMHLVIDPVKNGGGADANGNNGGEVDIENRLVGMAANARAGYDASNKRVWDKRAISGGSEERVYFFGVDWKRLGEYVMRDTLSGGAMVGLRMEGLKQNYYFGSRLVRQNDEWIMVDRLGNVVKRQATGQTAQTLKYYPYGQEYTVTAHEKEKFGTYWRDSLSGMDYADQRHYGYLNGRFSSPDPGPAVSASPQSWNRYSYGATDPVNFNDPDGRLPASVSFGENGFGCVASPFGSSGGAVDASSPCPPGMQTVYSGSGHGSQTRTQQVAAAIDQLGDLVEDWDYVDGDTVRITFRPEWVPAIIDSVPMTNSLAPIVIGVGAGVGWTVSIKTLAGAAAVVAALILQTGHKADVTPTERVIQCAQQFARDLRSCEEAYPPGFQRQSCFEAARRRYDECKKPN